MNITSQSLFYYVYTHYVKKIIYKKIIFKRPTHIVTVVLKKHISKKVFKYS